jgi:lactate permease
MTAWAQNYNPTGIAALSTILAALPVAALLVMIVFMRIRIHRAALIALALAAVIAVGVFGMPAHMAAASVVYGGAFGLFPVGWIILNAIFLYQLTVHGGHFDALRESLASIAPDPRIQLILIAFAFGAFLEGVAGFGAPVAITAAILVQLRFRPLEACALALIANTAPVAFGAIGIPIITLEQVAGLDSHLVSMMVGRQLPFFSTLIPFWIVVIFAGWRGMLAIWPAALTAGLAFAVPQFLVSNFHGPWLVDVISGTSSIVATIVLLQFWKPKTLWRMEGLENAAADTRPARGRGELWRAWLPWIILTVLIFVWGIPSVASALDRIVSPLFAVPHLHHLVQRMPPVVPVGAKPEAAVFKLNLLSATGSGILLAAIVAGFTMGYSPRRMLACYGRTLWDVRLALLTIAAMLALGNLTKYSGTDATMGLALAHTGRLYPFFGTLLGWLGVAMTGSDTSSNVLFGNLQAITARQAGISPILMGAANSSGGVMGKMLSAQSIVVATTATNFYGEEGRIIRSVFVSSLVLVTLMGILITLQAYCPPFTGMVPK